MNTAELVTHSSGLVASAKEQLLWLHELEARNRAGDYVLLDLNEIGIGGRHSKNRVEMRVVLEENGDPRPIVLIYTDAKALFHCGLAGNHDFLFAERAEIVESASQVAVAGIYIACKGFLNRLSPDKQVRSLVRRAEGRDRSGEDGTRALDQLPCRRLVHLKAVSFVGVEIATYTLAH